MRMRAFVTRHQLPAFGALAYALSWACWLPLALTGARVTPGGGVTHFPGLLGPALAAFVVTAITDGWPGIARLLHRMVWVSRPTARFLLYSLSPLAFLALAVLAAALVRPGLPSPAEFSLYSGLPVLPLPLVLLLVFLFNGFGEEVGWRGFALERLQRRFGALRGTLFLGLLWAGWHTPSFWFVEGYRSLGIGTLLGGFGLGILAGAIVLARIGNRTQGSILAAALWHFTYNLGSATAASRGVIGAVTTSCVMVWATVLLFFELRRGKEAASYLRVTATTHDG